VRVTNEIREDFLHDTQNRAVGHNPRRQGCEAMRTPRPSGAKAASLAMCCVVFVRDGIGATRPAPHVRPTSQQLPRGIAAERGGSKSPTSGT
jgi:hypothetical protein